MRQIKEFFVTSFVLLPIFAFYRARWLLFGKRRIAASGPFLAVTLRGAELLDVDAFVQHRMKNGERPNKAGLFRWSILHVDDQFVYSGYLIRELGGDIEVDVLYKTPRQELEQNFPDYERFDGPFVFHAIQQWLQANHPRQKFVRWDIVLDLEGGLHISLQTDGEENKTFVVVLHPEAEVIEERI